MQIVEISDILKTFYQRSKTLYVTRYGEILLDEVFGIENLQSFIADIYEREGAHSVMFNNPLDGTFEIFNYDDCYDFLNTLTQISPDDLYINVPEKELMKYTQDVIVILNKALNEWITKKNSGFKRGSKIYLEMTKDDIKLNVRFSK